MATGDWRKYTGAPESPTLAPVPFGNTAYGTDGNRTGVDPFATQIENSEVLTAPMLLGDELRFRSWHVDQGGDNPSAYDNKVVSVYEGGMNTILVNCYTNLNSQAFCQEEMGPRAAGDWDVVVLDTSPWNGMGMVQLRFQYVSVNAIGNFEQGWFIDDLRTGQECGP